MTYKNLIKILKFLWIPLLLYIVFGKSIRSMLGLIKDGASNLTDSIVAGTIEFRAVLRNSKGFVLNNADLFNWYKSVVEIIHREAEKGILEDQNESLCISTLNNLTSENMCYDFCQVYKQVYPEFDPTTQVGKCFGYADLLQIKRDTSNGGMRPIVRKFFHILGA